jgi:hypothetical protein
MVIPVLVLVPVVLVRLVVVVMVEVPVGLVGISFSHSAPGHIHPWMVILWYDVADPGWAGASGVEASARAIPPLCRQCAAAEGGAAPRGLASSSAVLWSALAGVLARGWRVIRPTR